jgi:hypothetical protein
MGAWEMESTPPPPPSSRLRGTCIVAKQHGYRLVHRRRLDDVPYDPFGLEFQNDSRVPRDPSMSTGVTEVGSLPRFSVIDW